MNSSNFRPLWTLALLGTAFAAPAAMHALPRAKGDETPLRIALVSDTHTTHSDKEDKKLYKGRLDEVIAAVNVTKPDVVIVAGDLTDGGLQDQFTSFKEQIRGFAAPVLVVAGNHDVGEKVLPDKPGGVNEKRVAAFESNFGTSFYVSVQPRVRVIGINSSLLGSNLPEEGKQWDFLEAELAKPCATPTVLAMHYPPFVQSADEAGGIYWNVEPAPRARLLDLLKKHPVTAVLTGPLHRPLQNSLDGIPFITTQPVSFGLPKGKQPQGWTLVTVAQGGEVRADKEDLAD